MNNLCVWHLRWFLSLVQGHFGLVLFRQTWLDSLNIGAKRLTSWHLWISLWSFSCTTWLRSKFLLPFCFCFPQHVDVYILDSCQNINQVWMSVTSLLLGFSSCKNDKDTWSQQVACNVYCRHCKLSCSVQGLKPALPVQFEWPNHSHQHIYIKDLDKSLECLSFNIRFIIKCLPYVCWQIPYLWWQIHISWSQALNIWRRKREKGVERN